MHLALSPHPATLPSEPPFDVWVEVEHTHLLGRTGSINIWYCIGASIDRFVVVEPHEPARVDGLWQSTCFEAFLQPTGAESYREWNLATSGDWAAYDFSGYRADMSNAEVEQEPYVRVQDNLRWWQVGATIPVEAEQEWRLGLSAILEEKDGTKSYWALAHHSEKPDFHATDCFIAGLP